eukprot:scaffold199478_cov43-Prasinocladus_malaysianus.AAC.1
MGNIRLDIRTRLGSQVAQVGLVSTAGCPECPGEAAGGCARWLAHHPLTLPTAIAFPLRAPR